MTDASVELDATDLLAEALGRDPKAVADKLGAPWFELQDVPGRLAFVTGVPAQVMIQVAGPVVIVGRPQLQWDGQTPMLAMGELHLEGHSPSLQQLAEAAKEAATARRKSFRWCRRCRELNDPATIDGGTCHGCMARYEGVVF